MSTSCALEETPRCPSVAGGRRLPRGPQLGPSDLKLGIGDEARLVPEDVRRRQLDKAEGGIAALVNAVRHRSALRARVPGAGGSPSVSLKGPDAPLNQGRRGSPKAR